MALADIKARIADRIKTVQNIGNVHTRAVNVKTAEGKKAVLHGAQNRLHAWLVTRESFTPTDETQNQSLQRKKTNIVVRGFLSVHDGSDSEAVFDTLIEDVAAAINDDRQPAGAGGTKLSGLVASCDPPYLRTQDHREYADTLCHYCEIVVPIEEDVQ